MSGALICILQWTRSLKDPHLYHCHSQLHGQHDILCNTFLWDSYLRLPQSIDIKTINKCWAMTLLSSFILFTCDLFSFDFLRECSGENLILECHRGMLHICMHTGHTTLAFQCLFHTSIFKSCSLCKVWQWHNIMLHILRPFSQLIQLVIRFCLARLAQDNEPNMQTRTKRIGKNEKALYCSMNTAGTKITKKEQP